MRDYTHFYRDALSRTKPWTETWTLFISAFNPSERVVTVFDKAIATEKHWLVHKEYNFLPAQHPLGSVFTSDSDNEADFILEFVASKLATVDLPAAKICIDTTGFMRPHLMFLVRYLVRQGVKKFDALYSEPAFYALKERTEFSLGAVNAVRQVAGFEGPVNTDTGRDLLVIGAGYETHLIAEVAEDKDKAQKVVLLGLPSLSCDMYQQNAWRTHLAADSIGESANVKYFAPANDPFATASVLSRIIGAETARSPITNLYLSPLSTKAQALGFVLYYLEECEGQNASIIFPFCSRYSSESAKGIARIWRYCFEFD
jgi:hypothetical protein